MNGIFTVFQIKIKKKSCKSAIMDFVPRVLLVGIFFGVSWRYKEHLCQILASNQFFPGHSLNLLYYISKFLSSKSKFSLKGLFIYYIREIFRKTNISYLLIRARTCAYQELRNVCLSENFANILNEWSQIYALGFSELHMMVDSKKWQLDFLSIHATYFW